jgi:hypothetical protein
MWWPSKSMRNILFALAFISIGILACRPPSGLATRGGAPTVLTAPKLVHVYNGTSVGYYTSTGGYGFGTAANSVFSAAYGTTPQMVQHTAPGTGTFYIGSTSTSVTFFNGYTGGYTFATEANSKFSVPVANTLGVAVNSTQNILYTTSDAANKKIVFFNALTGGFGTGGSSGFTFAGPPASLKYLAVDSVNNILVATDPTGGRLYFMNGLTGGDLGSQLANASCAGYSAFGHLITSESLHKAYVICNGATANVVFADTSAQTVGTTINVAAITSATDITYNTTNGKTVVVGGTKAVSMNASDGSSLVTFDANTAPCSAATATLTAATYDSATNTLYLADSTNNKIYRINGATMDWADNTACVNTSFSVAADLPAPTRLGFF